MPYRSRRQPYQKIKSAQTRFRTASTVRTVARRAAAQVINRIVETKSGVKSYTDGTQIYHNDFVVIDSNPLATSLGSSDAESTQGTRIGDRVSLKGLSFQGMLELNERYSDVTFRIMFIKSAKGDTPTKANMFQGCSSNQMLDKFNTERFTLVAQKFMKITTVR